jgi:type VI secretion system protein VasG
MSLQVDLRALLRRMNKLTTRALHTAVGMGNSRGHRLVTPDHLLAALLDESRSDAVLILDHFGIDKAHMTKLLTRALEVLKSSDEGKPNFSEALLDWIQTAWLHASVDLGQQELRSGGLMLALAASDRRGEQILSPDYMEILSPLSEETLRNEFDSIVAGSSEQSDAATPAGAAAAPGEAARSADSALGKFCIDLTAQARDGKIDPIFARDREIRQMVNILGRRRKNNPIVVGEAGVGKTAMAEGLALKIVKGDVPELLAGVDVLTLDLGLLQAGAGVRGEFENRLKSVIDEVKSSETPIILFIDEAHTLIGAGGSQGQSDAANLLKPALARGELRTVAATTWAEYKKYFETDAALSRRFEPVKLDEPGVEDAIGMLRGLKSSYEAAHDVIIRDEAIIAAVKLSSRYLAGRFLPDKAFDLLDTCAARVKVARAATPARLEDLRQRIEALHREREAVHRDGISQAKPDTERLSELDEEINGLQSQADGMEARWTEEKEAAKLVLDSRKAFIESSEDQELRAKLDEAAAALEEARADGDRHVPLDVDAEGVANTVSDWTGIPLGNMVSDEAQAVLEFEKRLGERIKGQDHALEAVGRALRASKADIGNPSQPMGVFFFAGPSGVGKTETALGIADLLFGGERFMTVINMSEFQEKHTVSLLKGAPPGYKGYGEGGVLTEAVRQRPYSVVLLDEVEKAHRDVMNLFYQVFDKGLMTDGTGRNVNFKNTIVILTSNLGTEVITPMCASPVPPDPEELAGAVKPILVEHFKPALNARWTMIPFLTIGPEVMKEITVLKLNRIGKRLRESHGITLEFNEGVVGAIADRCTEVDTGARNIDHIVRSTLLPKISTGILERLAGGEMPTALHLGLAKDGEFELNWEAPAVSEES